MLIAQAPLVELLDIDANGSLGAHRDERQVPRVRQVEVKFGARPRQAGLAERIRLVLNGSRVDREVLGQDRAQQGMRDDEAPAEGFESQRLRPPALLRRQDLEQPFEGRLLD